MTLIEIGKRNYLLCLILSHPLKVALLSPASRARPDRINWVCNERLYSGEGVRGRALELEAGGGYSTPLIACHARAVLVVEPVTDLRRMFRARCRVEGSD